MESKLEVWTWVGMGGVGYTARNRERHHVMTLERFGTEIPLMERAGGVSSVPSTREHFHCCQCLSSLWG